MYYKESKKILTEIKKAKKILIACHRGADLDTIGCALFLSKVAKNLNITTKLICSASINPSNTFLSGSDAIEIVDYYKFPFSDFDLLILPDIPNADQLIASGFQLPKIKTIILDHHEMNNLDGVVKIVDQAKSSVAEILFRVAQDCNIKIDREMATELLAGIYWDTQFFSTQNSSIDSLRISADLLELGAERATLLRHMRRSYRLEAIRLMGYCLENFLVDRSGKFTFLFLDYRTLQKFPSAGEGRSLAMDYYVRNIEGVDFCLMITEPEPDVVKLSFRAKEEYDVRHLAQLFGGNGHPGASGAIIQGDFPLISTEVLKRVREEIGYNKVDSK